MAAPLRAVSWRAFRRIIARALTASDPVRSGSEHSAARSGRTAARSARSAISGRDALELGTVGMTPSESAPPLDT